MMSSQPLDGVEVVELCSAISGPFAGRLLADHGAHVVKVEPLDGESYRSLPPWYDSHDEDECTYRFLPYNTSKESLAVDLKTDEGGEIVHALVDEADVVIENMRPDVMDRLGLAWADLRETNPDLVYCDITGYGPDGPYSEWPAMDTTVQAVGGWQDQLGVGDGPETMDVFVLDQATAVYAAWAICMSLVGAGAGNGGRRVEISMLDVAVSFLNHHLAEWSAAEAVDTEANFQGATAPNDVVEVADGHVALYVADEGWEAFCRAIERPAWAEPGHDYATAAGRLEHRESLRADLGEAMGSRPKADWTRHVNDEVDRAIAAGVNTIHDVLEDPQVRHNGSIVSREHPTMGSYVLPRSPARTADGGEQIGPAPALGADTDDLLRALGYDGGKIDDLRERGVIR